MYKLVHLLIVCIINIGVLARSSCNEKFCVPSQGDLASGRVLQVNGSCESSQFCSSEDAFLNDGRYDSRWVSEPGQQNASIQLDLETSFRFLSVNISFATFLPASAVLEASSDWGETWRVLQFYATDCPWYFGMQDRSASDRAGISDVVCTAYYFGVNQFGGSLLFDLILPQHLPFWATDPIQMSLPTSLLTITNLRLRLLALQQVNSLLPISYSISSFQVYGACHCYGHAETCVPLEGYEAALVPGVCDCRHSTEGEHCGSCQYGYNRKRWGPSTPSYTGFCEMCRCNSHSENCYYDIDREKQICEECQHNTIGDLCEQCAPGFYQNPVYIRRGWLFHPQICKDCKCDSRGALSSQCGPYGFCPCKRNVRGAQCDRCKPGFFGLDPSDPEGCRPCVCGAGAKGCDPVSGRCLCKKYATGLLCQTCNNGYYGPFPVDRFGCRSCGCSVGTTVQPRICQPANGACICREGVEGDSCSLVRDGYYVEEVTQGDVDTRVTPLCRSGDRAACDLAGIWFDETSQSKRCEEDLSSESCCSYSQKIISIYLNNGATPCGCHANGTQSHTCDKCGGQCECRGFTAGRDCSDCTSLESVCGTCPRASPSIGDCLDCFCNGLSEECSVARDWRRQLTALDTGAQDWVGISADQIQIAEGYNPFLERRGEHVLYNLTSSDLSLTIAFPSEYLGDRRNTYASILALSISSNFAPESIQIIISSVHGPSQLIRDISDLSDFVAPLHTLSVNLVEDGFVRFDSGEQATGLELRSSLVALGSLQLVLSAVSSAGRGDRYVRLFAADLWDSVPDTNGGDLASNVEVCQCPEGHTGQFCERCSPGYTRSPETGGQFAPCVPCSCSGHSDTCDPEAGTCRDCQDNTRGKYCHQCREGFYGDPSSPRGCDPCLCPTGPSSPFQVSNSCVAVDTSQPQAGHTCDCPASYSGPNCEGCRDGYRGDPVTGIPCERCDACYEQYLMLSAVVPAEIQALEAFAQSCQGWEAEFDFFERLQANITQLKQLISQDKLVDSASVCQLADSLRDTREILNETSQILSSIGAADPSLSIQETQTLIELLATQVSAAQVTPLTNFIETRLASLNQTELLAQFDTLYNLLSASNEFYLAARNLRNSLSNADIAISRSIDLFVSINITDIPSHIVTIEGHRNAITEVSVAARNSLCGQSTQCLEGTFQRLVVVANLFQSHIRSLTERQGSLQEPLTSLIANKSTFEDLLSRLVTLRDVLIPISTSLCELVPVVQTSIESVNLCTQGSGDASELSRISNEILQLSISLTVSETTEIVLFINRTLEQVLSNEQILINEQIRLQLVQPFFESLITHQLLLNVSFAQLLSLSPGLTADSASAAEQVAELELLRENARNLSATVQRIIADLSDVIALLPSLTERVENASTNLGESLQLRASNQERLAYLNLRGRDTADNISSLIDRSTTLIPQGSQLAQIIQEISATITERFQKLNDSYPRIEALRIKLNGQVLKVNQLREFANSILSRQTALEALLERTEVHLDTHVLSGQLQEIDATGKCLNYIGET